MYTVVIAEQTHLDCIEEYHLFLAPLLKNNNAVFCAWDPAGQTLSECVPELRKALAKGDKWRAVIVADNVCQKRKNPFDRVQHRDPEWDPALSDEDNRAARLEARRASLRLAAQQPLARLAAHLADFPLVTEGNRELMSEDPDFRDYLELETYKRQLQKEICAGEPADFQRPAEILCLARRTHESEEYDIQTSWKPHHDLQYSRFAEYNLYYPRMRYLLFDVLPTNHRDYRFDNVRFLFALILLAGNDLPRDALQPNRVYTVDCENDDERLSKLLQNYDDRLLATEQMLRSEIDILKRVEPEKMTDREVAQTFCMPTSISLRTEQSFDESPLYVRLERFGLFSDVPADERTVWRGEQRTSRHTLTQLLRQPAKSIAAAVSDVRIQCEDTSGSEQIHLLDELQVNDFREYLSGQETACIDGRPESLADTSRYRAQADKAAEGIEKKLDTRMTRKTFLIALIAVMAAYAVGFAPMLLTGRPSVLMLIAALAALALLAVAALICLVYQRQQLRGHLRGYNDAMRAISASVHGNLERYAGYLSHVCSLMKGNALNNNLCEDPDELQRRCKIYQKHVADIRELREEWGLTFSQFLQPGQERNVEATPFAFDFHVPANYEYPVCSGEPNTARVEFLQEGNDILLPVDFIRRISLRREELYD